MKGNSYKNTWTQSGKAPMEGQGQRQGICVNVNKKGHGGNHNPRKGIHDNLHSQSIKKKKKTFQQLLHGM